MARACSICRCGDPTFNSMGNNIYGTNKLHLAIDWDRFNKTQGVVEDGLSGTDHEIENRVTATVSYAFAERVVGVVRLPDSFRELTTTFEGEELARVRTDGLSDPELYALVRIWSSAFGPGLGRRTWISAVGGVKTRWGRNDVGRDGLRVDEHAQPGTGSTDLFGGLSGFYLLNDHSSLFASAQYRGTGRNGFGYKYGNITMANVAYEYKIVDRIDSVVELNFRHALRDQVDATGETDPSTGGSILYVTPRVIFEVIPGVVVRLAAQVPIVKSLYGIQTEKVNFNAGLTFLF
ncbi:MAG: hypothetical protein ABJC61_04410 [Acidobacteriota bacterium]